MTKPVDMTGKRYGRLVALYPTGKRDASGGICWNFRCDCGNEKIMSAGPVRVGIVKSCGCLLKPHGMSGTRLFDIWVNMRQRCRADGRPEHDNWGNRGIRVCDEWTSFPAFRDWAMATGYSDDLTIDRIDNSKGYSPENCRWATYKEQANNTRRNHLIEMDGETHTLKQWCEILGGVSKESVYRRVRDFGWSYEKALKTPPLRKRKKMEALWAPRS